MDKVIVSRLAGGLGNQMFQYAAARAVAEHYRVPLFLDTSFLEVRNDSVDYTIRHFELDVFNVHTSVAGPKMLACFRSSAFSGLFQQLRILRKKGIVINEQDSPEFSDIIRHPPPLYLSGYWQNENYFAAIRSILLREFLPKDRMSAENIKISDAITATNCASVHVRRGDYITNNNANQFHGVCSLDYYKRAISKMTNEKDVNHFFVFSDDIEWTKENLSFPVPVSFIDHNQGKESYWDMVLMSRCKHQIIANSSFSWWGAWLNSNQNKLVVAPEQWFAAGGGENIVPDSWIKL